MLCCLQLNNVRVCGPRYWPQVIELTPEGKSMLSICFLNDNTIKEKRIDFIVVFFL